MPEEASVDTAILLGDRILPGGEYVTARSAKDILRHAQVEFDRERWDRASSLCREAIVQCEAGGAEWFESRLLLGAAVVTGEQEAMVEFAITRLNEAIDLDRVGLDDQRRGSVYRCLGYLSELRSGRRRSENLREAIELFGQAAEAYRGCNRLEDRAHLKVAMGSARIDRVTALADELRLGVIPSDLEKMSSQSLIRLAASDFEEALIVFTEKQFPEEHEDVSALLERARALVRTSLGP